MEIGQVYKVIDTHDLQSGEPFWMIGRAESLEPKDPTRGNATLISNNTSERERFRINTRWCFQDDGGRTYRLATPEEIYYLDYCISLGKWVPESEVVMIPQYEIF
jgi:hypothetical protein